MTKELFKNIEELINNILDLLKKVREILNYKKGGSKKIRDLISLKYIKEIKHKIILSFYEIYFLDSYILLYQRIYSNKGNPIVEFLFRTIYELGMKRAQILFGDSSIEDNDKFRFKLLLVLSDLGFISRKSSYYFNLYKKLLLENADNINSAHKEILDSLSDQIDKNNTKRKNKLINKLNIKIMNFQNELYNKTKLIDVFKDIHIERRYSVLNYTVHGNPFEIYNLFESKSTINLKNPYRHILKTYSILLTTGVNVLNNIIINSKYDVLYKELDNINTSFKDLNSKLENFWKKYIH